MLRRRRWVVATTIVALLVVGIAGVMLAHARQGGASATGTAQPAGSITQQAWQLDAFTVDGQQQTLVASRTISMTFQTERHRVAGEAPCNSYGGTYTLDEARHLFHPRDLWSTLVACVQPGVMEEEYHYLTAFGRVTRYHLDGAGLTLQDDTGRFVLHYVVARA